MKTNFMSESRSATPRCRRISLPRANTTYGIPSSALMASAASPSWVHDMARIASGRATRDWRSPPATLVYAGPYGMPALEGDMNPNPFDLLVNFTTNFSYSGNDLLMDIEISGPGDPRVSGDTVRPWLENYPTIKTMAVDFDRVEVSGDLATVSGSGNMLLEIDGEEVTEIFDFIDVFRKNQSGTWLYSAINFNSKDAPA